MNGHYFLVFLFGLLVITIGAEILLRGASKIASLLKIKPIIIGLTVVAIGTSLPELAVGLTAIKEGVSDIAVGNIAGTNIVNILLILGLSAAIRPLPLQLNSIKIELFAMILASALLFFLSIDGTLSQFDSGILILLGLIYLIVIIRSSKKEPVKLQIEFHEEYEPSPLTERRDLKTWTWHFMLLFSGIIATIYGADQMIIGATFLAKNYGISDGVIGLTIVAIGTSAPELATTLVSTYKNERDVAIGNLLGSSVINIFIILGFTGLFIPNGIDISEDILWFDLPFAGLVALACYPVFRSDQLVSRKEGILFLGFYLLYLSYLIFFRT